MKPDKMHMQGSTVWTPIIRLMDYSDFFVTVDRQSQWRRHVAWAKTGKNLKDVVCQRFAAAMVLLVMITTAQMALLFNPNKEATLMRIAMADGDYGRLDFWIGVTLSVGCCVSIIGMLTTFTVWGMVQAIDEVNAQSLIRSSIGAFAVGAPPRYVALSLYLFFLEIVEIMIGLFSPLAAWILVTFMTALFFYMVTILSAFGRLIMYSGAMNSQRVLGEECEQKLLPSGLYAALVIKAYEEKQRNADKGVVGGVISQYGCMQDPEKGNGISMKSFEGMGASQKNPAGSYRPSMLNRMSLAELPDILKNHFMEGALEEDSQYCYNDFPPNHSFGSSLGSSLPSSSTYFACSSSNEKKPMLDEESSLLG